MRGGAGPLPPRKGAAGRALFSRRRRGGCLRNLSAALSLRSVRRRVLCRALHRVLRRSFRVPDFAPDFYAGRAPELLIFL